MFLGLTFNASFGRLLARCVFGIKQMAQTVKCGILIECPMDCAERETE